MTWHSSRLLAPAWLVAGLAFCLSAAAQESRARVTNIKLELNTLPSPLYQTRNVPTEKAEYEWLQIAVEYDTVGARRGWADEVTIQWYLLARPENTKPMLLQETSTYIDVADGKHHAVMYVRPAFIRRYCGSKTPNKSQFGAYVEIYSEGKGLARAEYGRNLPKNWWRAKEPDVRLVPGELLFPDDTPFAPLDYDYYEHPKPRARQ
jgi:hypothetical protein